MVYWLYECRFLTLYPVSEGGGTISIRRVFFASMMADGQVVESFSGDSPFILDSHFRKFPTCNGLSFDFSEIYCKSVDFQSPEDEVQLI